MALVVSGHADVPPHPNSIGELTATGRGGVVFLPSRRPPFLGGEEVKGRAILVEYDGEPRSLREIGLLIGVHPRTMVYRYHRGKRGPALFAPPDEKCKRRGTWEFQEVGDVPKNRDVCNMMSHDRR
jgi:hypothetical protein